MSDRPPLSGAERAAGLDRLDEPWPRITMERRFEGRGGIAWSPPYRPSGHGGQRETYVPQTQAKTERAQAVQQERERLLAPDAQEAAFRAAGRSLSSVEPPTPGRLGEALRSAFIAALDTLEDQESDGDE